MELRKGPTEATAFHSVVVGLVQYLTILCSWVMRVKNPINGLGPNTLLHKQLVMQSMYPRWQTDCDCSNRISKPAILPTKSGEETIANQGLDTRKGPFRVGGSGAGNLWLRVVRSLLIITLVLIPRFQLSSVKSTAARALNKSPAQGELGALLL